MGGGGVGFVEGLMYLHHLTVNFNYIQLKECVQVNFNHFSSFCCCKILKHMNAHVRNQKQKQFMSNIERFI